MHLHVQYVRTLMNQAVTTWRACILDNPVHPFLASTRIFDETSSPSSSITCWFQFSASSSSSFQRIFYYFFNMKSYEIFMHHHADLFLSPCPVYDFIDFQFSKSNMYYHSCGPFKKFWNQPQGHLVNQAGEKIKIRNLDFWQDNCNICSTLYDMARRHDQACS